jgi:hypothetical protein
MKFVLFSEDEIILLKYLQKPRITPTENENFIQTYWRRHCHDIEIQGNNKDLILSKMNSTSPISDKILKFLVK